MTRRLQWVLVLLAGVALSACQTLPRPTSSVPSPLEDEDRAQATALPPEATAAAASTVLLSASETTGAEVFARLQAGFRTPVCSDGEGSSRWRQRYAGNPRVFAQHLQQILPMLDFVSKEVQASGLPTEFALIPLVESWYRPEAIGLGGPAGMWQMIGSTARNHGIHIQSGYDGRLSPVESTRAALSYLKTLSDMFNDWQATVMAYNAGENRLLNAFERSGHRVVSGDNHLPQGLSHITYDYVAKLQALSCLIAEPQKQGLQLPSSSRFQTLAPVLVDDKIRALDQLATRSGIDGNVLRVLNPGFKSGRIIAGVPRLVLMPTKPGLAQALAQTDPVTEVAAAGASNVAEVANVIGTAVASDAHNDAEPLPSRHQVRHGDTLSAIAKHYGLSLAALLRINGLGRKTQISPGQTLKLVP